MLFAFCTISHSQVTDIKTSKAKTTNMQNVKFMKKIILSRGIIKDIKVNKPSNVEMTLRRAPSSVGHKKITSNKKNVEEQGWICTQESVDHATSGDKVALSSLGSTIYPGLIFDPEAFHSGTYQKISQYSRKPITLTVNGDCKLAKNICDPTEHNIAAAVGQMRSELKSQNCNGDRAFYEKEILSEEDLTINTAPAGAYMGITAKMNCNFESKSKSYKYLIDYALTYYSMYASSCSIENCSLVPVIHGWGYPKLDINAENVFHITTEGSNAAKPIAPEDIDPNWVYVNSVNYGKRLLVIIESNEDLKKMMGTALAPMHSGIFHASVTNNFKKQSALMQTSVRLFDFGGNQIGGNFAGMEVRAINEAIKNYLTSEDENYQPLSFTLKTIDDEPVLVQLTSEYTSRKCVPKTNKFRITWTGVRVEKADDGGGGGTEDIIASVKVRAYDKNGNGIADIDNKVSPAVYVMEKTPIPGMPTVATFTFGSKENPKTIAQSEGTDVFGNNKATVTFAFPDDYNYNWMQYNAKIVITSYVTEWDGLSANDVFSCGGSFTVKISDAPQGQYKIRCTHEGSIINLYFTVEPIYQQ